MRRVESEIGRDFADTSIILQIKIKTNKKIMLRKRTCFDPLTKTIPGRGTQMSRLKKKMWRSNRGKEEVEEEGNKEKDRHTKKEKKEEDGEEEEEDKEKD